MIACSQVGRLAWRLVVHSDLGLGGQGHPDDPIVRRRYRGYSPASRHRRSTEVRQPPAGTQQQVGRSVGRVRGCRDVLCRSGRRGASRGPLRPSDNSLVDRVVARITILSKVPSGPGRTPSKSISLGGVAPKAVQSWAKSWSSLGEVLVRPW